MASPYQDLNIVERLAWVSAPLGSIPYQGGVAPPLQDSNSRWILHDRCNLSHSLHRHDITFAVR